MFKSHCWVNNALMDCWKMIAPLHDTCVGQIICKCMAKFMPTLNSVESTRQEENWCEKNKVESDKQSVVQFVKCLRNLPPKHFFCISTWNKYILWKRCIAEYIYIHIVEERLHEKCIWFLICTEFGVTLYFAFSTEWQQGSVTVAVSLWVPIEWIGKVFLQNDECNENAAHQRFC